MKRILLGVALALLATTAASPPAHAQIAGAIGKPLPASELPTGTIAVRVIAGSPTAPLVGVEVTLLVNGEPRVARTDSAGRAMFPGLTPGATVKATALDEDKKVVSSDEFPVPDDGGARVMITTKPFVPVGGGAPFAGGGGMPEPRQLSGQPRPEAKDPPGQLSVLVCFDDLKDVEQNVPVTLVAYSWDGKISQKVTQTGKDGRALFTDLDRTASTAYYAIAQVTRGQTTDRLMSYPIQLDPQVGVRVLLSADKRASTAPPIDEQTRFDPQEPTPPGKVRVLLRGLVLATQQVELVDAATGQIVGHVLPERAASDLTNVEPGAEYDARTDEAPGTFDVTVHGGQRGTDQPLPNVTLHIQKAGNEAAPPVDSATDPSGTSHFELGAGSYTVTVDFNGKPMTSQPFDLTKGGAKLSISLQWDAFPRLQAMFDMPLQPNQTLYAQTHGKLGGDDIYRSLPFQLLADRGTTVSILVAPHVLFHFRMVSEVEDNLLAVRGLFEIENATWAPFRASSEGLVIPLPNHFKGALIAENEANIATTDAAVGFRILRPLPPLRTQFHGGFSMPVTGSDLTWHLDLPYGAFQSDFRVVPFPGLKVDAPGARGAGLVTMDDGQQLYDIPNISIDAGKSMQFTIHGLPSVASWRIWAPRIVGLVVVLTIFTGVMFAILMRPKTARVVDPGRGARRAKLLDELVELDAADKSGDKATKGDKRRREALLAELEKLWD